MKKIFLKILIIALTVIIMAGCSVSDLEKKAEALDTLVYLYTTPSGVETAKEVLRCFNEKDSDGLKSLFCKAISPESLDKQIEKAFNCFKGNYVSHLSISASSSKSVREGKIVKYHTSPFIWKIKTDENTAYDIIIYMYRVNDKNPDYIGISMISLYTYTSEDETVLTAEIGRLLD